jgi:hypothetical protein
VSPLTVGIVRGGSFLAVGDRLCADAAAHTPALTFGSLSLPQPAPPLLPASHFSKGVYFIGKVRPAAPRSPAVRNATMHEA